MNFDEIEALLELAERGACSMAEKLFVLSAREKIRIEKEKIAQAAAKKQGELNAES